MVSADSNELKDYWWDGKKGSLHKTVFGIVRFLDQNQNYKQQSNLKNLRLYGNMNVLGLSAYSYAIPQGITPGVDRVSLNIVQSMCDTATNKHAKNKVKPMFVTKGGDRSLQRKAKKLNQFSEGMFYKTGFYAKSPQTFLGSTIFGTGAIKIYRQGGDIGVDNVFIDELMVDDAEAYYGQPRTLWQRKFMAREVLVQMFPKFKSQIMACPKAEQGMPAHQNLSNNVLVVEGWHLPSGKDANDGRHAICIETVDLHDEEWTKDYFPFVVQRWNKRPIGFLGQGLSEQLTPLQVEINKILRTVQLSFHLCVPGYMIDTGSKIISSHLSNEIGRIMKYTGNPPQWFTANPVAPQLFEHLERLYAKAYEIAGLSQLSAQAKKPEGLDSGKAIRAFSDIEDTRHILVGQDWEQFHLDANRQFIDLAKEISADKEHGEYKVKVKAGKFLETIDWKDVAMGEDEYLMQCFPTSLLSNTPSGRLSDVQDWMQAGLIDKTQGMKLLDAPDLEAYVSLATAAANDIDRQIENMVEKGEYNAPEPFQDLALGIKTMQSEYLKCKDEKVSEERLELLRRWMKQAQLMLTPPAPIAAPGGTAGPGVGIQPGPAQAAPMPPPQSALLPNAPAPRIPVTSPTGIRGTIPAVHAATAHGRGFQLHA